jgi:hypothetical protein
MKNQSYDRREKILHSIFLVIILFTLSGCQTLSFIKTPTQEPFALWVTDLLINPVCQLPCWENITPGKTSWSDAYQIVKSRGDVTSIREPNVWDPMNSSYDFTWEFANQHGDGWISSDDSGKNVGFIDLKFSSNHLELNDLIEIYGAPDKLFIITEFVNISTDIFRIYLFYNDFATRYTTGYSSKNGILELTPQLIIYDVHLSSREDHIRNLQNFANNYEKYLVDWEGYGECAVP